MMCSIQPVNELLFFSYQPSAISFQPDSSLDLFDSVIRRKNPDITHTSNWGGKDIILHHLTQMFLEKIPAINHLI